MRPLTVFGLDVDKLAGGRNGHYLIEEEMRVHPRTRSAFHWVNWILVLEVMVGLSAIVTALILQVRGTPVGFAVWFRGVVVLCMTLTLFFFAWRAERGYYWGYQRLRLFSQIFPVITLVVATIPGLYPYWMVVEQIIFAVLMIGIADFLTSDHMRNAYPSPKRLRGLNGPAPE
ncbi:hypothetical protein [Arthrobacter sp. H14-L1]|uniref:hypothetical protein n=1 Tax=Arthrobacter sp. H14-L1 TaxID=2996697 RepID=UPI0022720ADA|nr:hypothetical protein [Arthrobacter sp. H14-L1]MCY0903679.1 hypothetical protein [Arthrobacter sp. H14-L1]